MKILGLLQPLYPFMLSACLTFSSSCLRLLVHQWLHINWLWERKHVVCSNLWFLQVKTIFLPTEKPMTLEACAPLIATLPLEVSSYIFLLYGTWIGLQIETSSTPPLCYCVHRTVNYLQFFTHSGMIEVFGIVILKLFCFSGLSYYLFKVFHVRWKLKSK